MSQPSVMLVGLPWDHPAIPSDKRDTVRQKLEEVDNEMEQAGYDSQFVGVTPEDGLASFIEKLKTKPVDGICIGFGIRGFPTMTYFFEQLVEAIRQHAPKTKLFFNTSPDTTVDAAKRWLPLSSI